MQGDDRWKMAQSYERNHWEGVAHDLSSHAESESLEWYGWRARRLTERLARCAPDLQLKESGVLEVGSGPVGTISYLEGARREAIDPLMDFYSSRPALIRWRSEGVTYRQGGGESLPFEDQAFSLVLIDNVIDHTRSPQQVLSEIRRVLRPEGVLYLSVNVHSAWGLRVRQCMELAQLDRGHPHNYTAKTARRLIEDCGFQMLHEEMESPAVARRKELEARKLRNYAKLILGIYDVVWESISRRR